MKLIIAVVQGQDAPGLLDALAKRRHRVTQINSAGGFLRESNVTLLLGVENDAVRDVLKVIRDNCTTRVQFVNPLLPIMEPGEYFTPVPLEVQVGGASVFIMKVQRMERLDRPPSAERA